MKYFIVLLIFCSACSAKDVQPELEEGKKRVEAAQSVQELRSECAKILRAAQD